MSSQQTTAICLQLPQQPFLVKNFNTTIGTLIAYYPFSNNTNDISGNQLNGVATGIAFVNDRNGVPNSAGFLQWWYSKRERCQQSDFECH